jgi:hypothetical protein
MAERRFHWDTFIVGWLILAGMLYVVRRQAWFLWPWGVAICVVAIVVSLAMAVADYRRRRRAQ